MPGNQESTNLLLFNALYINKYASMRLPDGSSAIERSEAFARSLPWVDEIRYLVKAGNRLDGKKCFEVNGDTPSDLLGAFPHEDYDVIVYAYADCPFLDSELTNKMYENHRRYLAQYSFADGYPYGMTPEILSSEIVPKLRSHAESVSGTIERDTLFTVIQEDINAFDIETELSEKDQRLLRVSASADTKKNFTILERIVQEGGRDCKTVTALLDDHPELLRSQPAYISLQLVDGCPQSCSYCPFPLVGGDILNQRSFMELNRVASIVEQVEEFCEEAVFNVSVWGEPSLHPDFEGVVQTICGEHGFRLVVETSCIGWDRGVLENVIEQFGDKVTWICSLDANTPELYEGLRGDGFKEALSTAEFLVERSTERTYIQAVRMKENEEHLESFYRHWKQKTDRVIIQKYSNFAGFLEDRKVADLSPVKRFPCWHIKRDLVVLLDGSVPACREDIKITHSLGNIFEESLAEIWPRGEAWFNRHIAGDYPDLCRNCDEYYTFNY